MPRFFRPKWQADALLRAVEQRDRAAFDRAFTPFYQHEFQPVMRWLGKLFQEVPVEELTDLTQEAMIDTSYQLWQGRIRQVERLDAFLRSTAKRKAFNYVNRQRIETVALEPETSSDDDLWPTEDEYLAHSYDLLNRHGDKCRTLLLRWMHRIPMREIAVELGYNSADVAKKSKERCFKQLMRLKAEDPRTSQL